MPHTSSTMATPTDTQISTTFTQDLAWARHHLFLLLAVGILTLAGVFGVESLIAKHDHQNFLQQQAILQTFTQQNAQVQAQTKQEIEILTQSNLALQQQIIMLTAAMATRDAQLAKDRQSIKTLPPPQLASKWGSVANEPAPSIDTNGNFIAPLPLVEKSVDALIQVPVLQQDEQDLKTQLVKETEVANNNDGKFNDEKKAHQSDNEQCKQTVATKDAEIKDIKAKGRKRDIIIAVIAGIFGFAARR